MPLSLGREGWVRGWFSSPRTPSLSRRCHFYHASLIPALRPSPKLPSSPSLMKGASLKRRLVTWGGVQCR